MIERLSVSPLKTLFPGTILVLIIALAASFISEHYNAPVMLLALLLGIAFNYMFEPENPTYAGVNLCASRVLRIGVALLGVKVTLAQITSLGWIPIVIVIGSVLLTIVFGFLVTKKSTKDNCFGLLSGGAVAICGASATLAIAAILPKNRCHENNVLFTVIAVTTLSTVAMIFYPVIYSALGFDHAQIGILLGATIHDVAQVVGAGYAVSEPTGDIATYVKLLRVAMLPIVVISLSIYYNRGDAQGVGRSFPWFAVGFAALLIMNSLDWLPEWFVQFAGELSQWLLVMAVSALGIKTSLKKMFALDKGYIYIIVAETVFLALLVTGLVILFVK